MHRIRKNGRSTAELLKGMDAMGYNGFEVQAVMTLIKAFNLDPWWVHKLLAFGALPHEIVAALLLKQMQGGEEREGQIAMWFSKGEAPKIIKERLGFHRGHQR